MQTRKLFTIALALSCVMAFAFIVTADGSDAATSDIEKTKDPEWGGFTDMKNGHFTVFLKNTTTADISVRVVVYDTLSDSEKDSTVATIPATGEETSVRMGFGYGSDGNKMVYYKVLDANDETVVYVQEGSFDISVSHSMWKNTSTYVTIVIIVLVIIVVVVIFMRSRTKKTVGGGKSFTELEAERKAKRTNKVAEKQTYKAGEKKSRK